MNLTATEVDERWRLWWKKWQEAEARVWEPLIDRVLELVKKHERI